MSLPYAEAWAAVGIEPPAELEDELVRRYEEPHRAYHTMQHLTECFAALAPAAHLAERLAEIQLALWFHDAIYDTTARDNEAKSADWAKEALAAKPDVADRVHGLVMATKHDAVPSGDAALLVDVDLSILGADEARFEQYDVQIRKEYAWVPDDAYVAARRKILSSFLERETLYGTDWFRERSEERARANLTRALEKLG